MVSYPCTRRQAGRQAEVKSPRNAKAVLANVSRAHRQTALKKAGTHTHTNTHTKHTHVNIKHIHTLYIHTHSHTQNTHTHREREREKQTC